MGPDDQPTMTDNADSDTAAPRSLRGRLRDGVRHVRTRGHEAWVEPGGVFDDARGDFREWFRKIWKARGGGLYALGFAVTFLYLEINELITDDIPTLLGLGIFDLGAWIEFAVDLVLDIMKNTLFALIWPVFVIGWKSPLGLILLIIAFALFPKHVKPHIEQWLANSDAATDTSNEDQQ